ncbi:MAG: Histone acetyltransferase HPA2 and related acetyltransferases, partial [uncultured Acetobacteraceae bacterium]
ERRGGAGGARGRRSDVPADGPAAGRPAAGFAARRASGGRRALHGRFLPLPLRRRRPPPRLVAAADSGRRATRGHPRRPRELGPRADARGRAGRLLRAGPAQPPGGESLLLRPAAARARPRHGPRAAPPRDGERLDGRHPRGDGQYLHGRPPARVAELSRRRLPPAPGRARDLASAGAAGAADPGAAEGEL